MASGGFGSNRTRGQNYNQLIKQSGLPLFREAGGRPVGWWNTLIGDLYEHVTIWEYDDMAAFERAIGFLAKNPAFARFVAERDPLLAGEESRFLRLAPGAVGPALPEAAPFVVHEIHRVPLARKEAYLTYMTKEGLGVLKANGFRPAGPWLVDVGRSCEFTYLFRFESLAERERQIARFSASAGGADFRHQGRCIRRGDFDAAADPGAVLAQAARPRGRAEAGDVGCLASSAADRSGRSCGRLCRPLSLWPTADGLRWEARLCSSTCLAECPRPNSWPWSPRPPASLPGRWSDPHPGRGFGDRSVVDRQGSDPRFDLTCDADAAARGRRCRRCLEPACPGRPTPIGDAAVSVDFLPFDQVAAPAGAAVWISGQAVLFAGPLVVNGPRAALAGSDTAQWVAELRRLEVAVAGAGRPRFWLMGRARAARPPVPLFDRAPPAGRLPHLPGPAP